jgi:hypothetical protein
MGPTVDLLEPFDRVDRLVHRGIAPVTPAPVLLAIALHLALELCEAREQRLCPYAVGADIAPSQFDGVGPGIPVLLLTTAADVAVAAGLPRAPWLWPAPPRTRRWGEPAGLSRRWMPIPPGYTIARQLHPRTAADRAFPGLRLGRRTDCLPSNAWTADQKGWEIGGGWRL